MQILELQNTVNKGHGSMVPAKASEVEIEKHFKTFVGMMGHCVISWHMDVRRQLKDMGIFSRTY